MPDYNFSYQLPSFQSFTGSTVPDILGLLQGYKSSNLGQQITGAKDLAAMGYRSAAELQGQTEANKMRQFDIEQLLRQKMFDEQKRQQDIMLREQLRQNQLADYYRRFEGKGNLAEDALRQKFNLTRSGAGGGSGPTGIYDITRMILDRNPNIGREGF